MTQIITSAILLVVLIFFFRKANKEKSKFGINLKRTHCPVCQTKQRIVRMPANIDQALFGGTICPKCRTKLDKYGNVIP
jgi:hypothetical protein